MQGVNQLPKPSIDDSAKSAGHEANVSCFMQNLYALLIYIFIRVRMLAWRLQGSLGIRWLTRRTRSARVRKRSKMLVSIYVYFMDQ